MEDAKRYGMLPHSKKYIPTINETLNTIKLCPISVENSGTANKPHLIKLSLEHEDMSCTDKKLILKKNLVEKIFKPDTIKVNCADVFTAGVQSFGLTIPGTLVITDSAKLISEYCMVPSHRYLSHAVNNYLKKDLFIFQHNRDLESSIKANLANWLNEEMTVKGRNIQYVYSLEWCKPIF
jgi:hypothetical protein